ncbi:hypothetical protein Syun_022949 [Stephania yunnanensis]|uniref:Uncharacterized protein n=1 Tax=Stephania yunnanensis TaxID=152371 RepID=A0AAP0FEY7_9MAGN
MLSIVVDLVLDFRFESFVASKSGSTFSFDSWKVERKAFYLKIWKGSLRLREGGFAAKKCEQFVWSNSDGTSCCILGCESTFSDALVMLRTDVLCTKAEAKILRGPHEDLESYLEAVDQLRSNIRFFKKNKNFKSSDGVLNHANNLLSKAILKLEEEFRQLLTSLICSSSRRRCSLDVNLS